MADAILDAEFVKNINTPDFKLKIDLGNYALSGTAYASSEKDADHPISALNDGVRTHINYSKGGVWESASPIVGGEYIKIKLTENKDINKIKIFAHPNTTLYNQITDNIGLAGFKIQICATLDEGVNDVNYVDWSELETSDEDGTIITAGVVTGNIKILNVFESLTTINTRWIKIIINTMQTGSIPARICEIELYRSVDISEDVQSLSPSWRQDFMFRYFVGAQLNFTVKSEDKKYYKWYTPTAEEITSGFFNSDLRLKIPVTLYQGFDLNGYSVLKKKGIFYISSIIPDTENCKVEFTCYDRVKDFKKKLFELGRSSITGWAIEKILEYLFLQCNVHTEEMEIDATYEILPYFSPKDKYCWDIAQKLGEMFSDFSLWINKNNKIIFKVYLDSIPHEIRWDTRTEFENGNISNLSTRGESDGKIRLPITKKDSTIETFNAGVKTNTTILNSAVKIIPYIMTFSDKTLYQEGGNDKEYDTEDGTVIDNIKDGNLDTYYGYKIQYTTYRKISSDNSRAVSSIEFKVTLNETRFIDEISIKLGANILTYYDGGGNPVKQRSYRIEYKYNISDDWITASFVESNEIGEWNPVETTIIAPNKSMDYIYLKLQCYAFMENDQIYTRTRTRAYPKFYEIIFNPNGDSGTFASREFDIESLIPIAGTFNITENKPLGSGITYKIGGYDTQGTSWADIPVEQKETIINNGTPTKLALHRYFKYEITLTRDAAQDVYVSSVIQNFSNIGTWESEIKQLSNVVKLNLISFNAIFISKITIETSTSDTINEIDFDPYELVINGEIFSVIKEYIKIRVTITRINYTDTTPELYLLIFLWSSGVGDSRLGLGVGYYFNDADKLKGLNPKISDEFSGNNAIYNRVIVKANPLYKQDITTVWQTDIIDISTTDIVVLDAQLNNPCATDLMELVFNGETITIETEFATSDNNFKITFTKDPNFPHIVIVPQTYPLTIYELYINAEPFISLGIIQSISEDPEKIKIYDKQEIIYENEYIVTASLADKVAENLLKKYRNARYIFDKQISIGYCPGVELKEIVSLSEADTGFGELNSGLCEVIGVNHKYEKEGVNSFDVDTSIQCASLNIEGFDETPPKTYKNILNIYGQIVNGQDAVQLPYQVGNTAITQSNLLTLVTNITPGRFIYIPEIKAVCVYVGSNKWRIMFGEWTDITRPSASWLSSGSIGLNTDSQAFEKYDGYEWGLFG